MANGANKNINSLPFLPGAKTRIENPKSRTTKISEKDGL